MKTWPVQDAKSRFSEMLETCLKEGPQVVTRRGASTAVLVPIKEWQLVKHAARPTLKDLLLADSPRGEWKPPARGDQRRRKPPALA